MPKTVKIKRVLKTARSTKSTYQKPKISLSTFASFITIYRKFVSNLKIREEMLRKTPSIYDIGPTIIWTEDADDLALFTTDEKYTHFIGFEPPFSDPRSKQYIKKQLEAMRMVKGTILIKEATTEKNPLHIPVHFCGYKIDESGVFIIFDPSWHGADPGIYSTTAFYDSLDAFKITYTHAFPNRKRHWQSLLPDDVFCQTWSLKWLYNDHGKLSLPTTRLDAAKHVAEYIREFVRIIQKDLPTYLPMFPAYKLEGNSAEMVFQTILAKHGLAKVIHDLF